jgi:outer membrane lipoprotein SlyB
VKRILLTASLVAVALAGCANGLDGTTRGTVESVEVVRLERDIHAYEELRIQPDLGDRLLIRLDDGRAITVTLSGTQRFHAGERVRVLSDSYSPYGPRVFHE